MKEKGFTSIVIGIIIAVFLLGGGYFIFRNKPINNQGVEIPKNEKTVNTENQPIDRSNQVSSKLEVVAPRSSDAWQIGKNYNVIWKGGEGKISIFLDDKTRESRTDVDVSALRQDVEAKKLPIEVLKGNIWYRPNLDNTGS